MSLVQLRRPGPPAWLAWSGGKNAAHALARERVGGLVAFVDAEDRLAGSEAPRALLEEQAASIGLELRVAPPPETTTVLTALAAAGVRRLVFGDAAGSASRAAHARLAAEAGLDPVFPLAHLDPEVLAREMIDAGIRCVLSAVDAARAPRAWVGRTFSAALLEERPPEVHPTGARGEFHTFVCGAPVLQRPVSPRWEALEHPGTWAMARLVPGPRRGYGR